MKRAMNNKKIHVILVILLSAFLHLLVMNQFVGWMSTDTDGYWLHAATFLGKDWSKVAQNMTSYYSWGYSLLLMIPMIITDVVTRMYKIAVIMNAALCGMVVLFAYDIGKTLFPKVRHEMLLVVAFLTSMYSTYILECGVSLVECLVFFLSFFLFWAFMRYVCRDRLIYGILASVIAVYAYIVHNRNIGILIAFILMMAIHCYRKRNWKHFLLFLIVILSLLLMKQGIDNWLLSKEMLGNAYSSNTYKSVSSRFEEGFSLYWIYSLIQRSLGEVWYTLAGSMLTAGVGVIGAIKKAWKNPNWDIYVFGVITWLFSIGVSAVFLIRKTAHVGGRIDTLIHGRYMESTIGVLIVFGLLFLMEQTQSKEAFSTIYRKYVIPVGIVSVLLSIVTYLFSINDNPAKCNWFSVVAILIPFRRDDMRISIPLASVILISVGLVALLMVSRTNRILSVLGCVVLVGMFMFVGYHATDVVSTVYKDAGLLVNTPLYNREFQNVCDFVRETQIDTFYVYAEDGYEAFSYQFVNQDRKVIGITDSDDLYDIPKESVVLIKKSDMDDKLNYELLHENGLYYICRIMN